MLIGGLDNTVSKKIVLGTLEAQVQRKAHWPQTVKINSSLKFAAAIG